MDTNSAEWMAVTEAREWIARYNRRAAFRGHPEARNWWADVINDIEKRRGKAGADKLRQLMNQERGQA
jgi:hypothetical protein